MASFLDIILIVSSLATIVSLSLLFLLESGRLESLARYFKPIIGIASGLLALDFYLFTYYLTLGNAVLLASLVLTAIALALLVFQEIRGGKLEGCVNFFVGAITGLLLFDFLLLVYYFVTSDFTVNYVWQFSSRSLPLLYKISGTWAGQEGTYLLWVLVIFVSALWLSLKTKLKTPLSRRMQIATLAIGLYFIVITFLTTPFKSIYEFEGVPAGFVPPDGNGLNALLINFWMAIHPPLMFIGYGAMTIPFAAAIVYLATREEGWEHLSRQWIRITWIFLGLGIAVGGLWAYLVLGWGGFWAWDPVETASLVPWLTLTGYLHAAALYRQRGAFKIAAPLLASVSFILVVYAAIVTRSGAFSSVHAFAPSSAGSLLLYLTAVAGLVSAGLALRWYLSEPGEEETPETTSLFSRQNIFYLTLIIFVILAFVSFWGITFPALIQQLQGVKVSIASEAKNFFNVWSYPLTLLLLLSLGFCLNYKEKEKEKEIKILAATLILTVLMAAIRNEWLGISGFYVLDHTSPFFRSEPPVYKFIGSFSLLSIFPSMIYSASAITNYLSRYLKIRNMRAKMTGTGVGVIHLGVVLILLGAVISTSFTATIGGNIPVHSIGQKVLLQDTGYSIKLVKMGTRELGSLSELPGTRISTIQTRPENYVGKEVEIAGKVIEVESVEAGHMSTSYIRLDDGTGKMWLATQQAVVNKGMNIQARGTLLANFYSNATNRTFPLIVFSPPDQLQPLSTAGTVQWVKLEVYNHDRLIGKGTAEFVQGKGGSATHPMVDRSPLGDVYVIFQGTGGGVVPLTLKIIPAINETWIGVILFILGIALIIAANSRRKETL